MGLVIETGLEKVCGSLNISYFDACWLLQSVLNGNVTGSHRDYKDSTLIGSTVRTNYLRNGPFVPSKRICTNKVVAKCKTASDHDGLDP